MRCEGVKVLRCEDVKVFIDSTLDSTHDKSLRKNLNTFTPSHLNILTS